MVKIYTYIDNKSKGDFLRGQEGENKGDKSTSIHAEDEIDQMLKAGWTLVSATTSEFVAGAFTATPSFIRLTVIFHKED